MEFMYEKEKVLSSHFASSSWLQQQLCSCKAAGDVCDDGTKKKVIYTKVIHEGDAPFHTHPIPTERLKTSASIGRCCPTYVKAAARETARQSTTEQKDILCCAVSARTGDWCDSITSILSTNGALHHRGWREHQGSISTGDWSKFIKKKSFDFGSFTQCHS